MNKIRKMILALLIIVFVLQSCNNYDVTNLENKVSNIETREDINASGNDKNVVISDVGIFKDEEFGGIFFNIKIDDFKKMGFELGDSVDIEFTNRYQQKYKHDINRKTGLERYGNRYVEKCGN